MKRNRSRGFTLLEILITTGIMVVMVGFMVVMVRSTMNSWRVSEERSELFAQSRRMLEIFRSDFQAVVHPLDKHNQGIKFIGDHDANARVRMRFVRTLSGESSWWVSRKSGRQLMADKYIDLNNDLQEADKGLLKPAGGLMEVMYAMDPSPASMRLWRTYRAPIGGAGSLFSQSDLTKIAGLRPMADNVLYLEFRFWTPWTTSWSIPIGEAATAKEKKKSPLTFWDSTRKTLNKDLYHDDQKFPLLQPSQRVAGTPLLPTKVLVTLVLREPREATGQVVLAERISPTDTTITLNSGSKLPRGEHEFKYVMIGQEWIRYESVQGNKIILGESGTRGARRTVAAEHKADTKVEVGRSFRWVINLPGGSHNYREK